MELKGLENIVEDMREPLRHYAEVVQQLVAERALSLTLFGAVVTPWFDRQRHTARNVLVLDEVELDLLRRLSQRGAEFGKSRITAPLVMTPGYIQASRDTFPLEFIEIKQNRMVLFGEDFFGELNFEESHVRLQCERELKVILIGLRQGLLAAAGRDKVMGALEREVTDDLLRTLRGILWLKGEKSARRATEVIEHAEKIVERPLNSIREALDETKPHGWEQFQTLYADVEALGKYVDHW